MPVCVSMYPNDTTLFDLGTAELPVVTVLRLWAAGCGDAAAPITAGIAQVHRRWLVDAGRRRGRSPRARHPPAPVPGLGRDKESCCGCLSCCSAIASWKRRRCRAIGCDVPRRGSQRATPICWRQPWPRRSHRGTALRRDGGVAAPSRLHARDARSGAAPARARCRRVAAPPSVIAAARSRQCRRRSARRPLHARVSSSRRAARHRA